MMECQFKSSALRDLRRLPKDIQTRIILKLEFYASSQTPLKFAKRLSDKEFGEFRFRIGDYRVVFDTDPRSNAIIVLTVGHRKSIYHS